MEDETGFRVIDLEEGEEHGVNASSIHTTREDLIAAEREVRSILRETGNQAAVELSGLIADLARVAQSVLFYGL